MARFKVAPDEVVLAELSPSRRSLVFPVLELILITGMIWLAIGFIDAHFISVAQQYLGPQYEAFIHPPTAVAQQIDFQSRPELEPLVWVRRGLLVLWLILAWRRCGRFMLYRFRSRIILTNHRLITATGHLRSHVTSIPRQQIMDARNRGSKVDVFIAGARLPYRMDNVPHAKRFTRMIRQSTRLY